ncbi:hypothetical protein JYG23_04550 [Sedimentibacter sp. zth1]|uniref:hypothetical protein n=1 Tax=Sedimentibacter sp. zth1 TaxID=2816908 RepID=UPI001A9305C2|nr:hypothetical protein [Sedimentibacter sp. zth1]QSX06726.1 hypothetical protein JYG23_04550 [Sedimentibacter sp. zth1]
MNYMWRITKYNPQYRDSYGAYLKDEWTSLSDVGKQYDGKVFTKDEYLEYERLYIESII